VAIECLPKAAGKFVKGGAVAAFVKAGLRVQEE
jgi:hypothetical protein